METNNINVNDTQNGYPKTVCSDQANGGKNLLFYSPKVARHSSLKSFSAEAGHRKVSLKDLHLPAPPVQRSRSAMDIDAFYGLDGVPSISLVRPKSASETDNQNQEEPFDHTNPELQGDGLIKDDVCKLRQDNARLINAIKKMSSIMEKTKSGFNSYLSSYNELQQYCASLEAENSALHMHIDNLSAQLEFAYYGAGPSETECYSQEADVYNVVGAAYTDQGFVYDANVEHNIEFSYTNDESDENLQNEQLETDADLDEEEQTRQYEDLEPKPVLQL